MGQLWYLQDRFNLSDTLESNINTREPMSFAFSEIQSSRNPHILFILKTGAIDEIVSK